jgi:hypothetical protein
LSAAEGCVAVAAAERCGDGENPQSACKGFRRRTLEKETSMTIRRAGLCRRQKPRFRIGTPLQDPYNKPLRSIPKTYFVIAIFGAAQAGRNRRLHAGRYDSCSLKSRERNRELCRKLLFFNPLGTGHVGTVHTSLVPLTESGRAQGMSCSQPDGDGLCFSGACRNGSRSSKR